MKLKNNALLKEKASVLKLSKGTFTLENKPSVRRPYRPMPDGEMSCFGWEIISKISTPATTNETDVTAY